MKRSPYRVVCYNRDNEIVSDSIPELGQMILYNSLSDGKLKEEFYIFGLNEDIEPIDLPLLLRMRGAIERQANAAETMIATAYILAREAIADNKPISEPLKRLIDKIFKDFEEGE